MSGNRWAALAAAVVAALLPASVSAQTPDLAGRWTLNRELSQFPREVGFNPDWLTSGTGGSGSGAGATPAAPGGRGRRGGAGGSAGGGRGGGGGPFMTSRESADDAQRKRQLTAEVTNPAAHLTIAETAIAVTITDDRGQSRIFHPDGRHDELQLDGVPVSVTSKWEPGQLVVVYDVEQDRALRYTYSRAASPPRLVVDVQFVEPGKGDQVTRVYEPAGAEETPAKPAAASAAQEPVDQRPHAELKGIKKLGLVVEGLGPQAAACGLKQEALETSLSKRLSDAGFAVTRDSDEDTYFYVNVMTSSPSSGLCVSRYDLYLYTHTTASLSYRSAPVLVEVSLLHSGGLAGGVSASHAAAVLRGLEEYVDQFSTRINDANR